jgi:REP element-mobilizing transposase RayT
MSKSQPLYPNVFYHIYNRGNNRENIFIEDRNYRYFLQLYAKYIEPVALTFAYCLLRNHYHLLVRVRNEEEQMVYQKENQTCKVSETLQVSPVSQVYHPLDPSRQFSHLFNAYTKAINNAYGRTGGLFEGRFKRVPVRSQQHLVYLVTYIHRNPEKHGFVDDFREWPYSSYHALNSEKPTRVQREEVLDWFQGSAAFENAHDLDVESKIQHLVMDDFF